ncbi:MAG: NAD(P)H-binding protein [Planctomycetota bacterium]
MAATHTRSNSIRRVLVTGGTGKTGRRVADRLLARDVQVRVGSRSATVPFDWHDDATWTAALDGIDAVYIAFYPDLTVPGTDALLGRFAAFAREQGVTRLVLLSGRGEEGAEACERTVAAAGVPTTVVRASWFMQNFSEGPFLDFVMSGTIALPAGEALEPFIDADDIADVAVAALTEDGHAGETYELTGPTAITFADAAAEMSKATGRAIRYEDIPHDAFVDGLRDAGLPADYVDLLDYLFTVLLDGRNSETKDGVRRALGREPRSFADYARDAAESWKAVTA